MNVGYEYLLPGTRDTGVERAIRDLLPALAVHAPETDLTVFSKRPLQDDLHELPNVRERRSRVSSCGRPARIVWQQLLGPAPCRREGLDIYHATGYVVSPRFDIPTVVSVYDTTSLERKHLTTSLNSIHYRWAVPRAIRSASRIIVPSEYVRNRLPDTVKVDGDRIRVVPRGISPSFIRLGRSETRRRLQTVFQVLPKAFVLFVGNVERKKNLHTLISAFAKSRCRKEMKLKLVLTGRRGKAFHAARNAIQEERLDKDVILTGYVTDEVLVALYNAALLVVYPSEMEGFGFPPLEAMACGTPVVASRAGSIPEVVGDAALSVDPEDSDELARELDRVLRSHETRESLVTRGFRRTETYDWKRTAKIVIEIYREACTSA